MNIQKMKIAWLSGWRIVARLLLLYLAMLVFMIPLPLIAELIPETAWRGWGIIVTSFNFLVVLPIGAYYTAKWCKEFKDETE